MSMKADLYCLLPEYDRRRKLTDLEKTELHKLKGKMSQREAARLFGVSRRTVTFNWHPEKLEQNKQRRKERGGWKQYYKKPYNTQKMKECRTYKTELIKQNPQYN